MYFTQGDTPAAPLRVAPALDGDVVDLELYSSASAQLVQPDGVVVTASAEIRLDDEDGPVVEVRLPTLEQAGLVTVAVQLEADGKRDTFDVEPLAVQALDGWHTIGSARSEWDGAKHLTDWRLFVLLETSKRECIAYLPAMLPPARPQLAHREAQLLHARNRNAASRIDPASGDAGVDGYAAGPFPLDWAVKQLLRPARRLGRVR
jgi:hypothetical protein